MLASNILQFVTISAAIARALSHYVVPQRKGAGEDIQIVLPFHALSLHPVLETLVVVEDVHEVVVLVLLLQLRHPLEHVRSFKEAIEVLQLDFWGKSEVVLFH